MRYWIIAFPNSIDCSAQKGLRCRERIAHSGVDQERLSRIRCYPAGLRGRLTLDSRKNQSFREAELSTCLVGLVDLNSVFATEQIYHRNRTQRYLISNVRQIFRPSTSDNKKQGEYIVRIRVGTRYQRWRRWQYLMVSALPGADRASAIVMKS